MWLKNMHFAQDFLIFRLNITERKENCTMNRMGSTEKHVNNFYRLKIMLHWVKN